MCRHSHLGTVQTVDTDCVDVWQDESVRHTRFLGQAFAKKKTADVQKVGRWEVGEDGVLKKLPLGKRPGVVLNVFIKSTTNLGYF